MAASHNNMFSSLLPSGVLQSSAAMCLNLSKEVTGLLETFFETDELTSYKGSRFPEHNM